MARLKNNETVLSLAVSKSDSLRTTVPIHIVRKLDLKQGDHIEWDIEKIDRVWFAIVKSKKQRDR